jgi:hypothetical protein
MVRMLVTDKVPTDAVSVTTMLEPFRLAPKIVPVTFKSPLIKAPPLVTDKVPTDAVSVTTMLEPFRFAPKIVPVTFKLPLIFVSPRMSTDASFREGFVI